MKHLTVTVVHECTTELAFADVMPNTQTALMAQCLTHVRSRTMAHATLVYTVNSARSASALSTSHPTQKMETQNNAAKTDTMFSIEILEQKNYEEDAESQGTAQTNQTTAVKKWTEMTVACSLQTPKLSQLFYSVEIYAWTPETLNAQYGNRASQDN